MGFFEEPAPVPPAPPSYRMPEWIAPPDNVIAATVVLDVILVRRAGLAIWVSDGMVFPTGVSFGLNVQRRGSGAERHVPLFFGPSAADGPRFGLQLADGRKVVVGDLRELQPLLRRPDRAVLHPRSGSGGGDRTRAEMWLWPLPPAGPLRFVCAWPAEDIGETSAEIDATPIVAAAARSVELWPDDRPLPPSEGELVV